MKRILCLALLLFSFFSLFAQIRFAPEIGYNSASVSGKINGQSVDTKRVPGFKAGFFTEIPLMKALFLQAGLSYSRKGYRETIDELATNGQVQMKLTGDIKTKIGYAELPVNLAYKVYMGLEDSGSCFMFFAGPYVGRVLHGRTKGIIESFQSNGGIGMMRTYDIDESTSAGNDPNYNNIRPWDVGLNIGVGYEFAFGLVVRGQYGLGLSNNLPGGGPSNSMKASNMSLSLAYLIP